jgi:formate dehydrogenase
MRRVGDRYVEATQDEVVTDIALRLCTIIDRDGKDAVGFYIGNPWGFSGSNPFFAAALQDAIGTRSLFNVGSIDQNG